MAEMKKYSTIILLIFTIFVLFLHAPDVFINQILFSEDGNVFFNQSQEFGMQALFIPYAGYSHLILRLMACFASFFPVQIIPYIYLLSVIFVQFFIVLFTYKIFKLENYNYGLIIALFPLLIPVGCEIYFSLTNLQWLLALLFVICISSSWLTLNSCMLALNLFLLSLTGPFSILLLPVVIVRMFLYKDLKKKLGIYALYFTGTLIQLFILFMSERTQSIYDKFQFAKFISFFMLKLSSINFWDIILFIIFCLALFKAVKNFKEYFTLFSLLYLGIAVIFSSLFILSADIPSRYMYLFLASVYLMSVVVLKNDKISAFIILLLIIRFSHCRYENIYWNEFTKFSQLQKEVFVPILPPPNWYAKLTSGVEENAPPYFVTNGMSYFNPSKICNKYTGISIETDNPGYAKVFMITDLSRSNIRYFNFYPVDNKNYKSNFVIPVADTDIQIILPPELKINCYCLD